MEHRVILKTYDDVTFSVPFEWLEEITVDEYNMTVSEFQENYTRNDANRIMIMAKEEGICQSIS